MLRSFNCILTMLAESWSLKDMTTRVTSFPANFPEACSGCWSAILELVKVLMAELIKLTPSLNVQTDSIRAKNICVAPSAM